MIFRKPGITPRVEKTQSVQPSFLKDIAMSSPIEVLGLSSSCTAGLIKEERRKIWQILDLNEEKLSGFEWIDEKDISFTAYIIGKTKALFENPTKESLQVYFSQIPQYRYNRKLYLYTDAFLMPPVQGLKYVLDLKDYSRRALPRNTHLSMLYFLLTLDYKLELKNALSAAEAAIMLKPKQTARKIIAERLLRLGFDPFMIICAEKNEARSMTYRDIEEFYDKLDSVKLIFDAISGLCFKSKFFEPASDGRLEYNSFESGFSDLEKEKSLRGFTGAILGSHNAPDANDPAKKGEGGLPDSQEKPSVNPFTIKENVSLSSPLSETGLPDNFISALKVCGARDVKSLIECGDLVKYMKPLKNIRADAANQVLSLIEELKAILGSGDSKTDVDAFKNGEASDPAKRNSAVYDAPIYISEQTIPSRKPKIPCLRAEALPVKAGGKPAEPPDYMKKYLSIKASKPCAATSLEAVEDRSFLSSFQVNKKEELMAIYRRIPKERLNNPLIFYQRAQIPASISDLSRKIYSVGELEHLIENEAESELEYAGIAFLMEFLARDFASEASKKIDSAFCILSSFTDREIIDSLQQGQDLGLEAAKRANGAFLGLDFDPIMIACAEHSGAPLKLSDAKLYFQKAARADAFIDVLAHITTDSLETFKYDALKSTFVGNGSFYAKHSVDRALDDIPPVIDALKAEQLLQEACLKWRARKDELMDVYSLRYTKYGKFRVRGELDEAKICEYIILNRLSGRFNPSNQKEFAKLRDLAWSMFYKFEIRLPKIDGRLLSIMQTFMIECGKDELIAIRAINIEKSLLCEIYEHYLISGKAMSVEELFSYFEDQLISRTNIATPLFLMNVLKLRFKRDRFILQAVKPKAQQNPAECLALENSGPIQALPTAEEPIKDPAYTAETIQDFIHYVQSADYFRTESVLARFPGITEDFLNKSLQSRDDMLSMKKGLFISKAAAKASALLPDWLLNDVLEAAAPVSIEILHQAFFFKDAPLMLELNIYTPDDLFIISRYAYSGKLKFEYPYLLNKDNEELILRY
ncbi:MAG: hypothetical protein LBU32_32360 [Clostridiales bacterium]|jgi:hypothetical protein|nr:hypothetical protein [Clostridiales bacterium]